MKRLLSSVGVGAATVDTLLPKTDLIPGETVEATVEITGGRSDQSFDALYFALVTKVKGSDIVLDQFKITDPFTIAAHETRTITTDVTLPLWTPVTGNDRRVWLKTGLDVAWAVDPTDQDDIDVVPGPHVEALLTAVTDLGFEYRSSELREPDWLEGRPVVQAFTYEPLTAPFDTDIDSLTVLCIPREEDLHTVVEIDERESVEDGTEVEFDEQEIALNFDTTNPDMLRRRLAATIDRYTHT